MTYTSDDVVLTNIRSNGRNGIDFDMYVQSGGNGVLSQQALLRAVEVSTITLNQLNFQSLISASLSYISILSLFQ